MKKFALFCSVALLLSSVSIGCSSSGGTTTSWCRTGSLFPVSRSQDRVESVYLTRAMAQNCNPCEPAACAPCEPVCNPCEPACDPCPSVYTRGFTRGVYPGPVQ